MMEERRRARLHDLATLLQKIWRGWHQRMLYLRMKRSQILISSQYRGYKVGNAGKNMNHLYICSLAHVLVRRVILVMIRLVQNASIE